MSQRVFCDNCDEPVGNYHGRVNLNITHRMSDGTFVGEDEMKPSDLCRDCVMILFKAIPILHKVSDSMREPPLQTVEATTREPGWVGCQTREEAERCENVRQDLHD